MHDKYLISDDKTYILGGRNTSDLFLGESENEENSFDRDIFIYNSKENSDSSIYQLLDYHEEIWNSNWCKVFRKNEPKGDIIERLRQHSKTMIPQPLSDYLENTVETNKVTLLFGEIHPYGKEPIIWQEMKNLMMDAKDRIVFHSPYAVLNEKMYQDVKEIVDQIEMKLVLNSVLSGDNIIAPSDYLKNREKILDTGVRLYEFQGIQSSHGKSIVIDERISIIGSYNFDLRSTYVNTEMMVVVDSEKLNYELETHFEVLHKQAVEIFPNQEKEWKETIIEEVPWIRRVIWKIFGVVLSPFRYAI